MKNTTTIHHFDPVTLEYKGSQQAQPDPLEPSKYLLPAHSTTIPPVGEEKPGEVEVFRDNAWTYVADQRGSYWDKEDKSRHVIDIPGDEAPASWTASEPSDPDDVWDTVREQWALPFEIRQARLLSLISRKADEEAARLLNKYNRNEQALWEEQLTGADDLRAGVDSAAARFLRDLAAAESRDVNSLVSSILARAEEYRATARDILLNQRLMESLVKASSTGEELDAAAAQLQIDA